MVSYEIQFSRMGSNSLIINWPQIISIEISENINQFIDLIKGDLYIEEFRVGYCSILIVYKSREINYEDFCKILSEYYSDLTDSISVKKHVWEIPVCYDDSYAIDLDEYSKKISISKNEIVSLHSNKTYYLHMYGFIPGFMYLGGLDKKLFIQRKDNFPLETSGERHISLLHGKGALPFLFFALACFSSCKYSVLKRSLKLINSSIDILERDLPAILIDD